MKRFLTYFIAMTSLILGLIGCDKIKTIQESQPILFKGLKAIEVSSKGGLILMWDQPAAISVAGYQIFLQDLTDQEVPGKAVDPASATKLLNDSGSSSGTATVILDLPDAEAPVTKGKLHQVIAGDLNSFEIDSLLPGHYAFQVRAVATDGRSDSNPRVVILSIESTVGYEGISKAELLGDDVLLEWPALVTSLKGQDVNYTVYEGPAFSKPVAITTDTKMQISVRGVRPGTILSYGVRSTDPKGRTDRNTRIITVTIPESSAVFEGCVKGEARGADRIRIDFAWPEEEFETFKIYRNGTQVFATRDKGVTEYLDVGLQEGEVYQYSCVATYKDLVLTGNTKLTVGTLTSNPPSFKGIRTVEVTSAHTAMVRWGVSTGVPTHTFKVHANPGNKVDWEADPVASVGGDTMEVELKDLGDDLGYAFGVRACSIKGVCDTNDLSLLASTRDDGAPKTTGASALTIRDGGLVITAPWTPSLGGISKRLVYLKKDGPVSSNIADYVNAMTVPVTIPGKVPTELVYNGITDNTYYHVIVRDQDPSGHTNTISTARTIFSGDTTAPSFPGMSSVLNGHAGQEENTLRARFTAIEVESDSNKYGTWEYIAYVLPGGGNACQLNTIHQIFPASDFAAGQEVEAVITGLQPKTVYGVCLKARDKAGNISATTLFLNRSTLDSTAPGFDGVQTVSFNKETGMLSLAWSPSAAADIYEYQVQIWKSNPDPTQVPVTLLKLPHAASQNGANLSKSTINLNSGEDIYVLVNACDNAGTIAGGTQNCSQLTAPKMLTLPDIEPPPGFLGIAAEPDLTTPAEGTINVAWIAPSDWTDYKGFKVYLVDPVTNTLQDSPVWDCACSASGCPVPLLSCPISGLDPFRSYIFHVRAYDAAGNVTQLDPLVSSTKKRSSDTTSPAFASQLTADYANGSTQLTWSAATDNQYPLEPGAVITYEVWRKVGTTFANPSNPTTADAVLVQLTQDVRWTDPGTDYQGGNTYFYTVCAVDGTGNRTCDANVKDIDTPDLTPPVISSFTSDKTESSWQWTLSWTASDAATPAGSIFYRIYQKFSSNPLDKATTSDTVLAAQSGTTTKANLQGPVNTDTYIHYLLEAQDSDGNKASRHLTIASNNKVTLTSVRSTEGPLTGNNTLVLVGDGFKSGATVSVGPSNCSSAQVISRKHILCVAPPAATESTVTVTVQNPDGSSSGIVNAYHYCDPDVENSCTNICNRPIDWADSFAAGSGLTTEDPFIICNAAHLNSMRSQPYGRNYALGENIDLNGLNFDPITNGANQEFRGKIQGNNYIIANWSYDNISADFVGLFKILNYSEVKDLGLINFNVRGRSYVGTLAGAVGTVNYNGDAVIGAEYMTLDGIFTTGTVVAADLYAGGILGRCHGNAFNMMSFASVTGRRFVGGLFGRKIWGANNLEYQGTVLATGSSNYCQAGGIAGYWAASTYSISSLKSSGTVTCTDDAGQGAQHTAGLIGYLNSGSLDQATSSATVTGRNFVGGLVGEAYSTTVTNASYNGSVTGRYYAGGLFGQLTYSSVTGCNNSGTVVAAVPVLIPPVTGSDTAGGIAGRIYGTSSTQRALIKNCVNMKAVTSPLCAGGLIGYGDNFEINGSSSAGDVTAVGQTGGLVGDMRRGLIVDSFATGNVTSAGGDYSGGLVGAGWSDSDGSTITRAQASGIVIGRNNVGGLAGYYRGEVTGSIASGSVEGNAEVGGLIGFLENGNATRVNNLQQNKATGKVKGDTRCGGLVGRVRAQAFIRQNAASGAVECPTYAGGFIAQIEGAEVTVTQSLALGSVTGNTNVGGFLGLAHRNNSHNVSITDSYARGNVKGNDSVGGFAGQVGDIVQRVYASGRVDKDSSETNIGGLIGNLWNPDGPRDAPYSYWDKQASGRSTSKAGVGKNTSEMLGPSLYSNWDGTVWSYSSQDYPRLIWELPPP
jgi:hypothetical protein